MATRNAKYPGRGWCPCPSNDYEVQEVAKPALRKRDRSKKGHVAFKAKLEETITVVEEEKEAESPVPESEKTRNNYNLSESVDQKADAFKQERFRIQLARLKSLGAV